MSKLRWVLARVAAAAALAPPSCWALPDDFRVLADDVADRGEWALELQASGARRRQSTGASERAGLVELSYGIAENVEVSAQFPASRERDSWRSQGVNLEAQWVAARVERGFFWGARAELGQTRFGAASDSGRSLEVRPIVGYHGVDWEGAFNLSARKPLAGSERRWALEPSAKLSRRAFERASLGVEAYSISRAADLPLAPGGRERIGLLALDANVGRAKVNLGLGRSWAPEGAGLVAKTVVGWDLD